MLTLHHLNDSRSQRILWLLEELGTPYEMKKYQRMETRLAPPELSSVHPLGKSPVITDGDVRIAESGAPASPPAPSLRAAGGQAPVHHRRRCQDLGIRRDRRLCYPPLREGDHDAG